LAKAPETEREESQTTRGRYYKPLRDQTIRQIRKLIVEEGLTPSEAQRELQIPERSFHRYMHICFQPEREVLAARISDEEIMDQLAILELRISKDRRDLITAANDPDLEPRQLAAMVDAYNLAAELASAIFKIHSQSSYEVMEERARNSLAVQQEEQQQ
jgi:hypothetical protein